MIKIKNKVNKKDLIEISNVLHTVPDYNRDFYITKENIRLFVKDNFDIVLRDLGKGDIIAWSEKAMALVIGFADKSKRKYLKLLASNFKEADKLLRVVLKWRFPNMTLYAKLKKRNEFIPVLLKYGFKQVGNRGNEVLLCRKVGYGRAN